MTKNKYLSGNLFTRQPLQIKETAVSKQIADYLDACRIYNDRLNSGMIFTGTHYVRLCKKGTPDRLAIVDGRAVYIEVKQLGKSLPDDQVARCVELQAAGAVVIVADSFDSFVQQFNYCFR